jgi:hypothetical protein
MLEGGYKMSNIAGFTKSLAVSFLFVFILLPVSLLRRKQTMPRDLRKTPELLTVQRTDSST